MEKNYWPSWLVIAAVALGAVVLAITVHAVLRAKLAPKHGNTPETKTYLYTLPLRLWHWCNALLFIGLTVSGFSKYFGILPKEIAGGAHRLLAMLFMAGWLYFITYNIVSGNGKNYIVKLKGFLGRCRAQARYYLYGIMKGEAHPFKAEKGAKFNPLQQVTYTGLIYLMIPAFIITGMLIRNPAFGNLLWKSHILLGVAGIAFIIGHIYLCTTGSYKTQLVKGMIDGYHRHDEKAIDLPEEGLFLQQDEDIRLKV